MADFFFNNKTHYPCPQVILFSIHEEPRWDRPLAKEKKKGKVGGGFKTKSMKIYPLNDKMEIFLSCHHLTKLNNNNVFLFSKHTDIDINRYSLSFIP